MASEKSYRFWILSAVAIGALIGSSYYVYTKSGHARKSSRHIAAKLSQYSPENHEAPSASESENLSLATAAKSRGNKYYNAGRIDDAIKCYTEAINAYPHGHPELSLAFSNRAACYLLKKNMDAVLCDCNAALNINPLFTKALDRRAKALEELGRTEEALIDCTAACLCDDFRTPGLVDRVEALARKISEKRAEEDFAKRIPTLPSLYLIREFLSSFPGATPLAIGLVSGQTIDQLEAQFATQQSLLHLHLALKYLELEDYNRASLEFQLALEDPIALSDSDLSVALKWHGTFEYLKGNMENALKILESALDKDPANTDVMVKLALVYLEGNNYVEMTNTLDHAVNLDQRNPSIYFHRGEILAVSGNLEGAINDFSTSIQLEPKFWLAYVHKTRALLGLQMVSSAKDFVLKTLELSPKHPDLLNCYGEVLVIEGNLEAAEMAFNEAALEDPKNPYVLLNKALLAQSHKKDPKDIEACLRIALHADPTFVPAHMQLAILLLSNNQTDEAMKHFDITARHARTLQELITVHSQKAALIAQNAVASMYPSLAEKLK